MTYSNELLQKIVQVGTLCYPLSKVVNVLDIEHPVEFKKHFYDKNHIVYKSYNKGLDKADLLIDSKLFNMAKDGDLKALEKLQIRKLKYKSDFNKESKKKK